MVWSYRARGRSVASLAAIVVPLLALCALCTADIGKSDQALSAKPLTAETAAFLKHLAINQSAPVYFRIFKEESELEVWKDRGDGRYVAVKIYPICNWSGTIGPKQTLGDHMSPEGFYAAGRDGLKPDSSYHLALNIGYPNALDRALGRNGDFIMVHGKCLSVGCFAMTDDSIEEIYALARDAIAGGQDKIPIHIFPFRMSNASMALHLGHAAADSWAPLKEAYDDFESARLVPKTAACGKRYIVNAVWPAGSVEEPLAGAECPAFIRRPPAPLSRKAAKALQSHPLTAQGQKTRTLHDIAYWDDAAAKAEMAAIKKREEDRKVRRQADAQRMTDTGGIKPMINP